jgi:predicted N-acyltransferase
MTNDYVIRRLDSAQNVDALAWDKLLSAQNKPTPFMCHAYMLALESSGSAIAGTGWTAKFFLLERTGDLQGACVVYSKMHSYGEYVFDWAWANAYHSHGLDYYPKAVMAVPFTPVPGSRLLAIDQPTRQLLLTEVLAWCKGESLSSLHVLFTAPQDVEAGLACGLMPRNTVQFHWKNTTPVHQDFEQFLGSLSQEKRKKIRQERKKVAAAGVSFQTLIGKEISSVDWDFFYRCYATTYREHGSTPYLTRGFFEHMANHMPEHWLMFVARRGDRAIACSLIALNIQGADGEKTAYGRYWGALERVDCLHFEACYYQPIAWCIANRYQSFEGGAQGEHKMARALMPTTTTSMHWLAHPAFSAAVSEFLSKEALGINTYLDHLRDRSPFKSEI